MEVKTIIKAFKQGKIIIFPTDTVWGVGCSLEFPQSIKRLYQIKGREENKPTAVLVKNIIAAQKLGKFSKNIKKIAGQVWPGAVTLIVPATNKVPKLILGPRKTIGLRIPKHSWLLKILQQIPLGIVATSANFNGQSPPLKKTMLDPSFTTLVDIVVQDVQGSVKVASTVIDTTTTPMRILRQGKKVPNFFLKSSS